MQIVDSAIHERPLLSYVIASSDMRYIEINSRDIYLYDDPRLGLVLRGRIPDCSPSCDADLGFMLLEYAMSCENCQDRATTAVTVRRFGDHLGHTFADHLRHETPAMGGDDRLKRAFNIVLASMNAPYTVTMTAVELHYQLAHCPLHQAAGRSALNFEVGMAYRAFVALGNALVSALAPAWTLLKPAETETEIEPRLLGIICRR
jgi:hypothetical protein